MQLLVHNGIFFNKQKLGLQIGTDTQNSGNSDVQLTKGVCEQVLHSEAH